MLHSEPSFGATVIEIRLRRLGDPAQDIVLAKYEE
jgi:hypothetical protein